jgi:hypothetical protein
MTLASKAGLPFNVRFGGWAEHHGRIALRRKEPDFVISVLRLINLELLTFRDDDVVRHQDVKAS